MIEGFNFDDLPAIKVSLACTCCLTPRPLDGEWNHMLSSKSLNSLVLAVSAFPLTLEPWSPFIFFLFVKNSTQMRFEGCIKSAINLFCRNPQIRISISAFMKNIVELQVFLGLSTFSFVFVRLTKLLLLI